MASAPPVARRDPPAPGRPRPDRLDHADEDVAEDHRVDGARRPELAQVLGDVAAAEAAYLDPDQGVVLAGARDGEVPDAERLSGRPSAPPPGRSPRFARSAPSSFPGGGGRA